MGGREALGGREGGRRERERERERENLDISKRLSTHILF